MPKPVIIIIFVVCYFIFLHPSIKKLIKTFSDYRKDSKERRAVRADAINRLTEDMDKLSVAYKCESCGSSVKIDKDHISNFCPFCGSPLPKASELISKSYEYAEKDAQRQLELIKLQKQEHSDKRSDIAIYFVCFMGILAMVVFIILAIKIL